MGGEGGGAGHVQVLTQVPRPHTATGLACGRNQSFGVAPNMKHCFPLKEEFRFRKHCVLGLRRSPSTDFNRLPGAPSDLASWPIAQRSGREPLPGIPVGPEKKPASPGALGATPRAFPLGLLSETWGWGVHLSSAWGPALT